MFGVGSTANSVLKLVLLLIVGSTTWPRTLALGAEAAAASPSSQPSAARTETSAGKSADAPSQENYLGVFARRLPASLAVQLAGLVENDGGLLVTAILPDSPASRGGVKPFDVLVRYDDHPVGSVAELKKLIVDDKPGREVRLQVIRAAQAQTLEVTLATRRASSAKPRGAARAGNAQRLQNLARKNGDRVIINKQFIQVPGFKVDLGRAPSEQPASDARVGAQMRTLRIVADRRGHLDAEVTFQTEQGETRSEAFHGTAEEIASQTENLPQPIGAGIRRAIEGFHDNRQPNRAFRFQIEPRVDGDKQIFRVSIQRPGSDGEIRIVEVEQTAEGGKSIQLGDLMKIDFVAAELKHLAPAIREKVRTTLQNVRVPRVQFEVEDSL